MAKDITLEKLADLIGDNKTLLKELKLELFSVKAAAATTKLAVDRLDNRLDDVEVTLARIESFASDSYDYLSDRVGELENAA